MFSSALTLLAAAGSAQAYHQINADFYMRKNIDPIVVPGEYRSHMHDFFGASNVNIDTNSSAELQEGCHTNDNPNDFSVYWFPTLYAVTDGNHVPITTDSLKVYYNKIEHAEIAFPQDFFPIAGLASATSQAELEESAEMRWFCEYGESGTPDDVWEAKDDGAFPFSGCERGRLQVILRFPDCVNPDNLSEYTYSSSSYGTMNYCPGGQSRIPEARFSVRFDTSDALPNGWSGEAPLELACGPSYCFHGDFMNGWLPEAAEEMLTLTDSREWQYLTGPLSELPPCEAVDVDPNHGTDDYAESVRIMDSSQSAETAEASDVQQVDSSKAIEQTTEAAESFEAPEASAQDDSAEWEQPQASSGFATVTSQAVATSTADCPIQYVTVTVTANA